MTDAVTPMMKQYRRIKGELPAGVVLFFRLGDFYEMFFEDAKESAPILDIALTKRNGMPMCGVPVHAVDSYLSKLIKAGKKVAICEQVEDAAVAQGIVRRDITRIVTPGTVVEDGILESKLNNFLAGVYKAGSSYGLALLDLSTGLFWGEEHGTTDSLRDSLRRYSPSECVLPNDQSVNTELRAVLTAINSIQVSSCDEWTFVYDAARDLLIRHFGVHSLEGFGCEGRQAVVGAAGGVLYYVKEDLHRQATHIRSFQVRNSADFMVIDESTCRNLDLVSFRGRENAVTLLGVLDVTKTAMGSRMLRDWILRPLADIDNILKRQDAVNAFCTNRSLLADIRDALGNVRDLERLVARINTGNGNGRDLAAIGQSLAALPAVRKPVENHPVDLLKKLAELIQPVPSLVDLIKRTIVDEPPIAIKEGGIIRSGYNPELDELRSGATEGRKWLAEYQASEQARTGIKTLKVRHNKVFGYYIEISKGQLGNVPQEYMRKQTLVNAERFITPELKEYESKILGAQDRAVALEYEIFVQIREAVASETGHIQASAAAMAQLDALCSLAERALSMRYVRPLITTKDRIVIKDGRHPVIEQLADAERFVPNDTLMDCTANQVLIITGPNMAGKSTYIRQVALLVIMAHIGSFVPASEAEICVLDRVFTRVGASDDLARGRSTFMVEMQETANILNNATPRSLIVLDEIGRGTSTFDGISIAWAVTEYLHNNTAIKAKTLFATHYHELTDLALEMPGVKNYNVLVREKNDSVVFLRKIVPGGADKSYGIQVARLAGLPQEIIERSKEILANLEEGELADGGQPRIARHNVKKGKYNPAQMSLFGETVNVKSPRQET
ncbi:MAG: DNA mismatch repair protein MutS [Kiritimatiellae bacterium]|nr:DNA mismatch repair protein MutS [Kiritimatiellia bacterium]MDD5521674.1 DNA mismatch repair protein MutS [Kiritimatiellia bacterium]